MGFFRKVYARGRAAYRAIAAPVASLEAERLAHQRLLKDGADLLTRDITRLIPQATDILDGLLRDVDEVLEYDAGAYDEIYDDDQIATSLDNAFLPVAQAKFSFGATRSDSKKLIPYLTDNVLARPGWVTLIQDLCHAEVTGVRLSRMVWANEGNYRDPVFNVVKFIPKDKRRFRIGDPDWENLYLVDPGQFGTGNAGVYSSVGFRKPVERDNFIVHRWRNTEDRNGWGKGIGARLYRLAKYRKPLIHLFLQALENMGGGLRYVEADGNQLKAYTPADYLSLATAVQTVLDEAKSGDTVVLPPGFKANLHFPPDSVGKSIQSAVDDYFDAVIERTINGIDRKQDQSRLGSAQLGKEMSKTAWRRHQFRGTLIAETLGPNYVRVWVKNNPWIYDAAGVDYGTPLPKLNVMVPGGEALLERAQVVNQCRGPVLKSEYYEAHGLTEVTQSDIDAGMVIEPGAAPAGGLDEDPITAILNGRSQGPTWAFRSILKQLERGRG